MRVGRFDTDHAGERKARRDLAQVEITAPKQRRKRGRWKARRQGRWN